MVLHAGVTAEHIVVLHGATADFASHDIGLGGPAADFASHGIGLSGPAWCNYRLRYS